MRSYFAPAIAFALMMSGILCARSDDIPTLDVRPVCRGIASQSELEVGLQQTNFEQCVQSEQDVRGQLKKEWPTFSAADRQHCVALAKTGGESSYTELITCMEMARDVRALRSVQAAASGEATTRTPSSPSTATVRPVPSTPTPTPAPAPAPANSSASRSSSPKEPANSDVDSTLKELQRVKADAQNARIDAQSARTSEALTQHKLADTEADLKRAKEEAERATKQAEQAKADAQSAREAQARAENKLADAEAARSAAEERLKASESAAKSQSGFGTRLRSWFGHKPSNP
jgi:DNA polymerase III gamma/tau subunit